MESGVGAAVFGDVAEVLFVSEFQEDAPCFVEFGLD